MRSRIWLAGVVVASAACSPAMGGIPHPAEPRPDVVVAGDHDDRYRGDREYARSPAEVPPGHYPPPGECRVWYPDRPVGHQPPPHRCDGLVGRVPFGTFVLYNDRAWDTEYDWRRQDARRPGSVPGVVLHIMSSLVRD